MKYIKITLLLAIAASNTLHCFNPGDAASAGPSNSAAAVAIGQNSEDNCQSSACKRIAVSRDSTEELGLSAATCAQFAEDPSNPYKTLDEALAAIQKDSDTHIWFCPVCKKFNHRDMHQVKKHIATHYPPTLECKACGKKFIQRGNLKRHEKAAHDKTYILKCPECEFTAKYPGHFNVHMKIKHPEYFYDKKQKNWIKKQDFVGAADTETATNQKSERPQENQFECPICKRTFKEEFNLTVHARIHTRKTLFKCDYDKCDREFTTNSQLNRHKATHTGQKKFQCPYCDRTAIQRGNLTTHIQLIHPGKPVNVIELQQDTAASTEYTDARRKRDYRKRNQLPNPVNRRERSPEPRPENNDSSASSDSEKTDIRTQSQIPSYANSITPTNKKPAQLSQEMTPSANQRCDDPRKLSSLEEFTTCMQSYRGENL